MFEVKNIWMMDLFLTNMQPFALQDITDVFIAVWTLILTAPIHCDASIGD